MLCRMKLLLLSDTNNCYLTISIATKLANSDLSDIDIKAYLHCLRSIDDHQGHDSSRLREERGVSHKLVTGILSHDES